MSFEETKKIINSKESQVLLSAAEIKEKVKELGQKISEDYRGKCPILVGVLNGSFISAPIFSGPLTSIAELTL